MLKRELCSPRNKKNGEEKQKPEKSRKWEHLTLCYTSRTWVQVFHTELISFLLSDSTQPRSGIHRSRTCMIDDFLYDSWLFVWLPMWLKTSCITSWMTSFMTHDFLNDSWLPVWLPVWLTTSCMIHGLCIWSLVMIDDLLYNWLLPVPVMAF